MPRKADTPPPGEIIKTSGRPRTPRAERKPLATEPRGEKVGVNPETGKRPWAAADVGKSNGLRAGGPGRRPGTKVPYQKRPRPPLEPTEQHFQAFLESLRRYPSVTRAVKEAGLLPNHVYYKRRQDEQFAKDWDQAIHDGGDALEAEALRRGVEGVERAIYHKGEVVGTEQVYSDGLLMFMLKAVRPKKFRETPPKDEAADTGQIAVVTKDDEQL